MPQDNTEIVRRGFDAWNRRDDEAVLTYFSEAIEIDASDRVLNPAVYRGLDGARRFRSEIAETWDGFHVEIEEVLPAGDLVVVLVRVSGQGRASGPQSTRARPGSPAWTLARSRTCACTATARRR